MGFVWFGYLVSAVGVVAAGLLPNPRKLTAAAILNVLFAAAITGYVFSEDDYVNNGSSRWSNRELGPHAFYAAAMAAATGVAIFFALAATGKPRVGIPRSVFALNGLGLLIVGYLVLFAFDNN